MSQGKIYQLISKQYLLLIKIHKIKAIWTTNIFFEDSLTQDIALSQRNMSQGSMSLGNMSQVNMPQGNIMI